MDRFDSRDTSSLDTLGILTGTNKSSVWMDYLRHYEHLFAEWRDAPINIIEIGVANGASLSLWRQFFSAATIVGIDIDPSVVRFGADRVEIRVGSQADVTFMKTVCQEFPPTIIIDDGSHRADHVRTTFDATFPTLVPGGIYVMEDLWVHFGEDASEWRGDAAEPPHNFLFEIASRLIADNPAEQIDSMQVISGAVALRKKAATRDWAAIWQAAKRAGSADNWHWLALTMHRSKAPPEMAAEASALAVGLRPNDPEFRVRLAYLLAYAGRNAEAAAEAGRLLQRLPAADRSRQMLEQIVAHHAAVSG